MPAEAKGESNYLQQSLSCPVTVADSSMSCLDVTSLVSLNGLQSSTSCVGQLYLRLARLPPRSEDLNQHPKPPISRLKSSKL